MPVSRQLRASLALLRTGKFGTFWFATLLSNIGTWAQEIAEPWLLLSLGASPFLVGLDAFVGDAPAWLFTLAGGVLADHRDRRKVIMICQSLQMLCPIALVIALLTGSVVAWLVIALSFIVGMTDALSMPSYQSIVPSIVAPSQIGSGLALSSTQYNLSRILGPAVAGWLIATVGVVGCFAVNTLSYIPFIAVALWILPRREAKPRPRFDRSHPLAGMKAILKEPHLRGALMVVFATSLLSGPLITFIPVLIRDAFARGAGGYSFVLAAFGAGGLLGAAVLLGSNPARDRRKLASWCAIGHGVIVIAAALDPWFYALPALVLLGGLAMTTSNTSANTLIQSTAEPALRGQTVSIYMLAIRGGMALGSLATGITVSVLGVRTALVIDGCLAVVVQLVLSRVWLGCRLPPAEPTSPGVTVG